MNPNLALVSGGKKLMWDGRVYDTREDASLAGEGYRNDNFEVLIAEEGGKFLVYTRRVVREVVVAVQ
ncbi:MAG TPA: hypothetical protein VEO19_00880 [Terriglobia bacterium]|nr:hypothetical protein [Terriglobia bacterium]